MSIPKEYEEEISYHRMLFSGSALQLGRIQWYMQKANTEMASRRYIEKDRNRMPEITPFGEDVGRDEIYWWIFKRETEIEELAKRTETVLRSAQKLKSDSFSLKGGYSSESYKALIDTIKDFTQEHTKEIHDLHEYLSWLNTKDVLAPKMLFTYRVWGSTRLSDRMVRVTAKTIEEDRSTVEKCVESACGLRLFDVYTIGAVYSDIGNEIADSMDEEYSGPIFVPKEDLIMRTCHMVLDEMATYFEFLRQSLRNILLDIDRYNEQMRLLKRESFWRPLIQKVMGNNRIESQLWDFKETLEIWYPEHEQREIAKVKFCEEIASFANTEGGALIVGVTDKLPRRILGIQDLENKLKFTKEVLGRHVVYDADFTHFQQVLMKDDRDKSKTCLIIAVAQTKDVVSVKDQQGRHTYPRRLETGLDRTDFNTIKKSKEHILLDNFNFMADLYNLLYDRRLKWAV